MLFLTPNQQCQSISEGHTLQISTKMKQSINQSQIFRVVEEIRSLHDPLKVRNKWKVTDDNIKEWGLNRNEFRCWWKGNRDHTVQLHTHPFNGPFSGTTQVSRYQKGETNLDFTKAIDSERQRHQLGHMQVYISLQTDDHASTPPLKFFLQTGCSSCRPTNSVEALKAICPANNITIYEAAKIMV